MHKPLKIKDLVTLLGCSRQTIYNMLKDGRLPVKPIAGTKPRLWNADEIKEWLENRDSDGARG